MAETQDQNKEKLINQLLSVYDVHRIAGRLYIEPDNPIVEIELGKLRREYEGMSIQELEAREQMYVAERERAMEAIRDFAHAMSGIVPLLSPHTRRISAIRKGALALALLSAGIAGDIAGIDELGGLEYTIILLSEAGGAVGLINSIKLYLEQIGL